MLRKLYLIIAVIVLGTLLTFTMRTPTVQYQQPMRNVHDLGMYDFDNSNAFGTTLDADRRWEDASVRKEFHHNPFPLAEGCTSCAKKGVPDSTPGHTHVCKCGPPSKRALDAMGGNNMLPHACAPCNGEIDEPSQLGRWWKRHSCSAPESVGLDIRPTCTRCGN